MIEIWQPRWHDRKVLIATYKVTAENEIIFTKAPSLPGRYRIGGDVVRSCPVETNGAISVYAVPLDKLTKLED